MEQEHKVTVLISVTTGVRHPNFTEEVVPDGAVGWYEKMSQKVFNREVGPDMGSYKTIKTMIFDDDPLGIIDHMVKNSHKMAESLLRQKSKVDLLIVPGYGGTFLYYISEMLQCPLG